jgi:hypothetical protein
LNEIKSKYVSDGLAPVFPGYEILIAETSQEITTKASDYLNVTHNQSNAFDAKKLSEKVKELDLELRNTRTEHKSEIMDMQVIQAKLEAEKT